MSFGAKVETDGITYDCFGYCKKCKKNVDFEKGICPLCKSQKGMFS